MDNFNSSQYYPYDCSKILKYSLVNHNNIYRKRAFFIVYSCYFILQILINFVLVSLLMNICKSIDLTDEAGGVLFLAVAL